MSRVLAAAVELRTNDPHLKRARAHDRRNDLRLGPRNPRPLADALFPIIGPAIRKAIATTLSGMLESLNTTLEHSLSMALAAMAPRCPQDRQVLRRDRPAQHAGLPGRAGVPDSPAVGTLLQHLMARRARRRIRISCRPC